MRRPRLPLRKRHGAMLFGLGLALETLAFSSASACHGDDDVAPQPVADADDAEAASDARDSARESLPPIDSGPIVRCKLDDGTDPVALCIQKVILRQQHEAAFIPTMGVARSWDSKTFAPDKDGLGKVLHDAVDDVGYGAAIARYRSRARTYGDNEITATLVADLLKLSPLVEAELSAPSDKDLSDAGRLYANLRVMAGGLRDVNENDRAAAIDKIAEAYGRTIGASFVVLATETTDGGTRAIDGIFGVAEGDGSIPYGPGQVATDALALLDMAIRHFADEPANAKSWQQMAKLAIDHLWNRAREPKTQLLYGALATKTGASADSSPPGAVLPSDVHATVILALLRAQGLANKNPIALADVATYPFEAHADALLDSLNAKALALWDGTRGGYLAGWDPKLGTVGAAIAAKNTRSNAELFGALHRAFVQKGTPYFSQVKTLRSSIITRTPTHAGLFSVVADQPAFFERVPVDFDFASEGETGPPFSRSYTSAAVDDVAEALDEQWLGLP